MYLQQLSNVQGEEDNGGSDQGEEHEEVGEPDNHDDRHPAFMTFLFQAKRVPDASF